MLDKNLVGNGNQHKGQLSKHGLHAEKRKTMTIIGDIQLHEKQIQAQLKGALLWNIKGDVKWTLSRQRQHQ